MGFNHSTHPLVELLVGLVCWGCKLAYPLVVRVYRYLLLDLGLEKGRLLVDDLDNHNSVRIPLFGIDSCIREAYKVHPQLHRLSLVATDDAVIVDLMPELLRQSQKVLAVAFECVDGDFRIGFAEDQGGRVA